MSRHLLRPRLKTYMHRRTRIARISSPLSIAGCVAWFDANDISTLFQDSAGATPVTTTGDPVGKWNDKSGLNNHVTQPGAGSLKPAYTTGVQNSKAGISFDGGDYLDSSATYPSFPLTIVGAGKRSATISAAQGIVSLYHGTNFGSRVTFGSTNLLNALVATPSTSRSSVATIVANAPHIFGGRFNTVESANVLNGVINSGSHAASAVTNIFRVGGLNVNNTSTLMNGYMCEVAIYNVALNDVQLYQLAIYFNLKWGVY